MWSSASYWAAGSSVASQECQVCIEGSNPFARSTFSTKDLRFRRVKVSTVSLNKFTPVTPVPHCSLASQILQFNLPGQRQRQRDFHRTGKAISASSCFCSSKTPRSKSSKRSGQNPERSKTRSWPFSLSRRLNSALDFHPFLPAHRSTPSGLFQGVENELILTGEKADEIEQRWA